MLYHVQIRTLSRQQLGLDTIPLEEGEGVLAVVDLASVVENCEAMVIHHGLGIS